MEAAARAAGTRTGEAGMEGDEVQVLVVEAGSHRVGLPLEHVQETMRPLPIGPLRDDKPFVLGLARIRGTATPVLDVGAMLGQRAEAPLFSRFVTLAVGERAVALAVDRVIGIASFSRLDFKELPPLLSRVANQLVASLALSDSRLVLVLETSRLLASGVETTERSL